MSIIITIAYIFAFAIFAYCCGLISVWSYEMRKNSLYRQMQEKMRSLENSRSSMAVMHIKKYKISEDYRRRNAELERVQQFILEKVLFTPSQKYPKHKDTKELFFS